MATVAIFCITYAGVALGRIPGLMLDRTGIALLGAIAMVVSGAVPLPEAIGAIDLPTIILLYALMVVSAQLRLGGFYTWVALQSAGLVTRPSLLLATVMGLAALLSAILANDIICLAFTPVLCATLLRAGRNPLPYLMGLAVASNIGSAATIIGNPQNMLIGQVGRLDFAAFLLWCGPPSLLALLAAYGIIQRAYRQTLGQTMPSPPATTTTGQWPECNRWQTTKGLCATALLMLLFFTTIPRELSAITVAGVLLCSRRMHSRHILELVDWHLITLFCALFIVIHGITVQGLPARIIANLASHGINLADLPTLAGVATLMSNLVSNVPAVMLLLRFLDPGQPAQWYTLAAASTYAGNLLVIGSIANLIVIEQARPFGVAISFREHATIGLPVTLSSLLILLGWFLL
ncbi:MAG TPA: anion transporter [Desulfurivibrionaceae bacterium]|nr:anion transporter [Desulfurivibrionaceae bacterium]